MTKRISALLGLGAILVGAAGAQAQDRMAGSGIRVSKDQAALPIPTTTTTTTTVTVTSPALPAFSLASYANLSEKNMTALMAAGDSIELSMGRLAQTKGTDSRVRGFGTTLVTDHTAHLAKTMEIITDEDVGAQPLANDPEGARMRAMLTWLQNTPAGTMWDAEFLRFQAQHHQNVIDILTPNIKNAHDDDLEDHIDMTITSLSKHRDMARSIGTSLGVRQ